MDAWANLCRCCLSSETEVSLLDAINLKEKFCQLTNLKVQPDDKLPNKLCKECCDNLEFAYNFRDQCIKMEEQIRLEIARLLKEGAIKIEPSDNTHETDDEEFANDPMKQLNSILNLESQVKQEPVDVEDDDCYYVLVIDDEKDKEKAIKEFTETSEVKIKQEIICKEDETQKDLLTKDSYNLSEKVPDNVPATILENEEDSQEISERLQDKMDVDDTKDSNSQELVILPDIVTPQDATVSQIVKTLTGTIVNGNAKNNLFKILGADATGTILLKNADEITYLANDEEGDEGEDQDSQQVILYEGDDSSPFQIVNYDGNQFVIEYDEDGQPTSAVLEDHSITYLCDCGEQFQNSGDLKKHQITQHSEDEEHICNLCGKGFESAEILVGHNLLHNSNEAVIKCPFCETPTKRGALTQHIKNSHSNIKPRCALCYKTFANSNNLKRHMMIHNGVKEFQCDICFKRFHQKITMQTHRTTHMNPFACNACDETFRNKNELDIHKDSNQCNRSKVSKIKEELMKTIKQVITTDQGNVVGFACSLCKKMFSVEVALEQHIESCHISDPMDLLCSVCGVVLPSKVQLEAHLQTHKNLKTRNSKRFPCHICGKGCSSHAMLVMHERVHTNERPFPCQLCTLRFKTKTHLRTHQLTHTREKKFGCSVCMKFFALKGNLVVHLRTHTGERPYVCSLCDEAFIDSKYLKKHKLKKHAIENVPWNHY